MKKNIRRKNLLKRKDYNKKKLLQKNNYTIIQLIGQIY